MGWRVGIGSSACEINFIRSDLDAGVLFGSEDATKYDTPIST